jgi:phage shock protein A
LEASVAEYGTSIADHKVQLESLLRSMDDLKAEQAEAVADIITAKEEKEISDLLSGISQDSKNEELQRMRELRNKVKAEARVSRELAGTDTKSQEAEFLDYARKSEANSEFDDLIGLGAEAEAAAPEVAPPESDEKLPE